MRRWVTRSLICLVLGAVTTVLVAWGQIAAAWRSVRLLSFVPAYASDDPPAAVHYYFIYRAEYYSVQYGTSGFGGVTVFSDIGPIVPLEYDNHAPTGDGPLGVSANVDNRNRRVLQWPDWAFAYTPDYPSRYLGGGFRAQAAGWPMLALVSCVDTANALSTPTGDPNRIIIDGIPVDDALLVKHSGTGYAVLPTRPLPLGFAVNTVLGAIAWLVLFTGTRVFVRAWRRRRHHCTHCNYDLRNLPDTTDKCPECGTTRPLFSAKPASALSAPPQ